MEPICLLQVGKEVKAEEEVAEASVVVSVMVSCSCNVMVAGRQEAWI